MKSGEAITNRMLYESGLDCRMTRSRLMKLVSRFGMDRDCRWGFQKSFIDDVQFCESMLRGGVVGRRKSESTVFAVRIDGGHSDGWNGHLETTTNKWVWTHRVFHTMILIAEAYLKLVYVLWQLLIGRQLLIDWELVTNHSTENQLTHSPTAYL